VTESSAFITLSLVVWRALAALCGLVNTAQQLSGGCVAICPDSTV